MKNYCNDVLVSKFVKFCLKKNIFNVTGFRFFQNKIFVYYKIYRTATITNEIYFIEDLLPGVYYIDDIHKYKLLNFLNNNKLLINNKICKLQYII